MKTISILTRTVLGTLLISASAAALAGGGPRGSGPGPYPGATATAATALSADAGAHTPATDSTGTAAGKSREQVRAELLEAERQGLVPSHRNDYPPSAVAIARNRARFEQIEQAWQAKGVMATAQQ